MTKSTLQYKQNEPAIYCSKFPIDEVDGDALTNGSAGSFFHSGVDQQL